MDKTGKMGGKQLCRDTKQNRKMMKLVKSPYGVTAHGFRRNGASIGAGINTIIQIQVAAFGKVVEDTCEQEHVWFFGIGNLVDHSVIDVLRPHFTNVLRESAGEEEEKSENRDEGAGVHFFSSLEKGEG